MLALALSINCGGQEGNPQHVASADTGREVVRAGEPTGRFVLLPEGSGAIASANWANGLNFMALDTMTGKMCRTWDFTFPNTTSGTQKAIEGLPLCSSLYDSPHRH